LVLQNRRNERWQYLSTIVINAGIRPNFWKKAAVKRDTSAKNVEVQICKNCFQVFLLGKTVRVAIPAQPERAQQEHADSDRKDL